MEDFLHFTRLWGSLRTHCFSDSLSRSFFFFHPQVLWLMGALCISGFWGHCFNDTEYGAILCVMVKGLSVPHRLFVFGFSSSFNSLFVVSFMPEDKDNNTCWYLWKHIWHCFLWVQGEPCLSWLAFLSQDSDLPSLFHLFSCFELLGPG